MNDIAEMIDRYTRLLAAEHIMNNMNSELYNNDDCALAREIILSIANGESMP